MKEKTKKLVILTGYVKGESYGLLGPQMAATIINDHTEYQAMVVGITHEDSLSELKTALNHHFKDQQKIIGFSSLGGRPDLFNLARELKQEGAVTILAGPQAGPDYKGETGWKDFPHRFKGVWDCFSFALQGPAQQIIPILSAGPSKNVSSFDGVLCRHETGSMIENPPVPWADDFLSTVDWQTLYGLNKCGFDPLPVTTAQVLQQIGCPHAAKEQQITIDYPADLDKEGRGFPGTAIYQKGCSFCDVAVDKGYRGAISESAVKGQLLCLPRQPDHRKIPFELINESPLVKLHRLFELAEEEAVALSQINLTLRADYLLNGMDSLEAALKTARSKNVRILLSSIGFESFDDTILKNLNKGVTRKTNLGAIKSIRKLKKKYPANLGYLREEGSNHGFIHPTPWDTPDISREINKTISIYQLSLDILPLHSTPLIIHHASGLADWLRQIEIKETIKFQRIGTTIGWWKRK